MFSRCVECTLVCFPFSLTIFHDSIGTIAQSHTQPQQSHPASSRIIELIDCEVRRDRNYIAMVLEAGDIDLAKVLTQKNAARNTIVGAGGSGSSAGAAG